MASKIKVDTDVRLYKYSWTLWCSLILVLIGIIFMLLHENLLTFYAVLLFCGAFLVFITPLAFHLKALKEAKESKFLHEVTEAYHAFLTSYKDDQSRYGAKQTDKFKLTLVHALLAGISADAIVYSLENASWPMSVSMHFSKLHISSVGYTDLQIVLKVDSKIVETYIN